MSERDFLKQLTNLNKTIRDQDIVDVILVFVGVKPAAIIDVSFYGSKNSKNKVDFENQVSLLEKTFKNLVLAYKIQVNYPKNKKEYTPPSFIAKNKKILKELIKADKIKNPSKRSRAVGDLMGYPKTAITAFAKGKSIDSKKLPKTIQNRNYFKFLNFRLSENWEKEIKYLKKRAHIVKKFFPKLYKKLSQ